jgi:hypothetical protein
MTKGINPAASYTCYANVKAKNPSRPVDESMLIHVIRSNRELRLKTEAYRTAMASGDTAKAEQIKHSRYPQNAR